MVWATHHFKEHLRGHQFILFTDHKPLQTCADLPANKTLTELQQLALDSYFIIQHKKGFNMPADFLSWSNTTLSVNAIQLTDRDLPTGAGSRNPGSQGIPGFRTIALKCAALQPSCNAAIGNQLHHQHPPAFLGQNGSQGSDQKPTVCTFMPLQGSPARGPWQHSGRPQCN